MSQYSPPKFNFRIPLPEGKWFSCDEEPNMLGTEQNYGYFPVSLGQKLNNGKLEVIRKLGWSLHSTVWLARTIGTPYKLKYVAVKILNASTTSGCLNSVPYERNILDDLTKKGASNPSGLKYSLHFYEGFFERSPYGLHGCIVTEVLFANLNVLSKIIGAPRDSIPISTVKRIIKQQLLALDNLHRVCTNVHTNIKPYKILVRVPNVDAAIDDALKSQPSKSYADRHEPLLPNTGTIKTIVSQPLFIDSKFDHKNIETCLIGFGGGRTGTDINERSQKIPNPAPEAVLKSQWGTSVDIWSIGSTTYELLTGFIPFAQGMDGDIGYLKRTADVAGKKFNQGFLDMCKADAGLIDQLKQYQPQPRQIDTLLREHKTMSEGDIAPAAAFIQKCLDIDPRSRPTAQALLRDSWLSSVSL